MTNQDADVGPETLEEPVSDAAVAEEGEFRLSLDVQIEDTGPCKKHVRVRVPREDIDHYYDEAVSELVTSAAVPGFRVGHVPKRLVEKRFRKELGDQVKQKVLVQSLEQLSEEQELDPINEPDLDVESLELPEDADFEYEFDVEVRPDFELPDYEGLQIERPLREITDADVEHHLERFLSQFGELEPRDGPAEPGDYVVVDIEFRHHGRPIRKLEDLAVRLRPVLRFHDAELEGFDELMAGASAGEVREVELTVSREAEVLEMRGEPVHAAFAIDAVKRPRMPELNRELLDRVGVESEEELRDEMRRVLDRQAAFQQRQATRAQVLAQITASADWELPEQLVLRQVENALRREVLEMQQAGFSRRDIQARENEIRQRAVTTTRQALKEHFVLDKIATRENIEVEPMDIESEIRLMALQQGESPRRIRARLTKSGMIENLEAQIRERKAVDFILDRAKFVDVEATPQAEDRIEAVGHSICGAPAVTVEAAEADEEA